MNEANAGVEALFETPNEANEFISLLGKLKVKRMWYYPDSNASEEGRIAAKNQWSKATAVDKNQIKTKCLWKGDPQHQSSGLGRVSVFVEEKKNNSTKRSSGVQAALHYIAVYSLRGGA